MRKVSIYRIGTVAISVLFISFFISACANKTTTQTTAQKTEQKTEQTTGQAGVLRQQLTEYVSSLPSVAGNNDQDQKIREKIIVLAQEIKPAPAIPQTIDKYEGRAEAAISLAKTPADFLVAAQEYRKALLIAPWVGKLYFNLATVLEKAEKPKEAIRNYNLYLLAAPDASDKAEVRRKVAGLEFGMEKAASDQAAEQQKEIANENLAAQLVGIWHEPSTSANYQGKQLDMKAGYRIRVEANGATIRMTVIGLPTTNAEFTQSWYSPANQLWIEGEIKEGRLVGTYYNFSFGSDGVTPGLSQPYDYKIEVSDDGSKFKLGETTWEDLHKGVYIKE